MIEVRRSTVIDAPAEDVWLLLRDFNGHAAWHPAVAASEIEAGAPASSPGAVRRFRLRDGAQLREQLLSLSDAARSFTYCILDAPLPLDNYVATLRLRPVTDGARSFIEWRSTFDTPAARRADMTRLVDEEIYAAGFAALRAWFAKGAAGVSGDFVEPARRDGITIPLPADAIVIDRHGGPEVLRPARITVPPPGPGEVRIRQSHIGVNFIDIYCRTGYFDLLQPPGVPGMEAAGVVESVGAGVALRPGQRVAYASPPVGAYTSLRTMDARLVIPLPDDIDAATAAANLLKGVSARFLLHEVAPVKRGDIVLVHAAAGGVGLLLCQWASALGAIVVGTTSSDEKAALAKAAGCAEVINYARVDFTAAVMEMTRGRGADIIFDAVGRDTFAGSIAALKLCGHLVSFGQASGDIGAQDIGALASRSVTLSRPNYGHYTDTPEKFGAQAARLFAALRSGVLRPAAPRLLPLAQAGEAHRLLESRQTTGAIVLTA